MLESILIVVVILILLGAPFLMDRYLEESLRLNVRIAAGVIMLFVIWVVAEGNVFPWKVLITAVVGYSLWKNVRARMVTRVTN